MSTMETIVDSVQKALGQQFPKITVSHQEDTITLTGKVSSFTNLSTIIETVRHVTPHGVKVINQVVVSS